MMHIYKFSLLLFVILKLIGIIIFLKGFFPIKQSLPGRAAAKTFVNVGEIATEHYEPVFGRLVIILIDALRADFVLDVHNSSLPKMRFVQKLIQEHKTISVLAKANPPTVTMPRIKALSTGGIPGFVDIVLNFDSKALNEDNLLYQLRQSGKKILFYGDDTWIKLFPEEFSRTDGTTSFFVTDYTEVDNNVTRHIEPEFEKEDWDVMILHYLGLDHIGHLAGPRSPLLKPKLEEMDQIVEKIYNLLLNKDKSTSHPSLLVLCGDHGMSDQGSHGGSSKAETLTPLILMSSLFESKNTESNNLYEADQIDMASTISVLLGTPIPINNLGYIIKPALNLFPVKQSLDVLHYNTHQLLQILKQNFDDYENEPSYLSYNRAVEMHRTWLKQDKTFSGLLNDPLAMKTVDLYYHSMENMRNKVASSLSKYDMQAMLTGIFITWMVLIALLLLDINSRLRSLMTMTVILITALLLSVTYIIVTCTCAYSSNFLCSTHPLILVFSTTVLFLISVSVTAIASYSTIRRINHLCIWIGNLGSMELWFFITIPIHAFSLVSSSFVEEEHQTWYFYVISTLILLVIHMMKITAEMSEQEYKQNIIHNNINSVPASEYNSDLCYQRLNKPKNQTKEEMNIQTAANTEHKCFNKDITRHFTVLMIQCAACAVLCRILRKWNQTGDKWSHVPDIGDWLVRPENKAVLSCSCLSSLVTVIICCVSTINKMGSVLFIAGTIFTYCFRSAQGSVIFPGLYSDIVTKGSLEARIVYSICCLILFKTIFILYNFKSLQKEPARDPKIEILRTKISCDILNFWILLMLLLLRPHNMPLVSMLVILEKTVSSMVDKLDLPVWCTTLLYLMLGQASFYYQGNSNSISTVDVSAGYIGIEEYQPVIIGLLMCISTYCTLLFWILALVVHITNKCWQENSEYTIYKARCQQNILAVCHTLCLTRVLPLSLYFVLVTLQRYHLFVWSVFSPKLLYEGMLSLVLSVVIVLLYVLYR